MSVLQRKAQVGKREHQARAVTVPKALRVGLAKLADEEFDLALAVIGLTQDKLSAEQIESVCEDSSLLLLLDGPDRAVGGAVLDGALVTAMVQQQTMGRVLEAQPTERKMTATDAALCAPLIDGLFARAHGMLDEPSDRDLLARYMFGARAENKRLFCLAMEAPEYHVLRLTIDVAAGLAQSNMTLIVPVPEKKPERRPAGTDASEPDRAPVTMENAVMGLQAELSAILCRMRLPLADIGAFEVGQTLKVRSEAFEEMELVTIDGRILGKGVMGQIDGKRALMLSDQGKKQQPATQEKMDEASSDYANLELPALELSHNEKPIDPSNLDSLPDLPDIPDLDLGAAETPALPDLPDLDGLPDLDDLPDLGDLPNLESNEAAELPDLDLADPVDLPDLPDLPALDELPKINVA